MQQVVGAEATAVRSQSYYLDVTPPGCDTGTFVQAMAKRLGISTDTVATIGDQQTELAMFRTSAMSHPLGTPTATVTHRPERCPPTQGRPGRRAGRPLISAEYRVLSAKCIVYSALSTRYSALGIVYVC